jgi:hypothetical protein
MLLKVGGVPVGSSELPPSAFELIPAVAYGHSWMGSDNGNTVGARWLDRVKSQLRMGTITNRAVSGHTMYDLWNAAIAGASIWTVGTKGAVFVQAGANEMLNYNVLDAQQADCMKQLLRSLMLLLGASARWESSTFTESGTWSTFSFAAIHSGGTVRRTTTAGDYTEFTFTGTDVTVFVSAMDPASLGVRDIDVTVDGVAYGTYRTDKASNAYDTASIVKVPIEITGLTNALHTVRLTATATTRGAGGTYYMEVDFAAPPSATPPQVIFVRDLQLNPASISEAELTAYNDIVDYAIAGLDYVTDVDASTGWVPATMLHSDYIHPNDLGSSHVARAVVAAMAGVEFRNGINALAVP